MQHPMMKCIVSPVVSLHTCEISNQYLKLDQGTHVVGDLSEQPSEFELLQPPDIRKFDHQPQNLELFSSKKEFDDDDRSLKFETMLPQVEPDPSHKLIKLEPLSPKTEGNSDDESKKLEPFLPEKVEDHDESMTLDPGYYDDKQKKTRVCKN